MSKILIEVQHLQNRLCFGCRIQDLESSNSILFKTPNEVCNTLFQTINPYKPLNSYSEEFMVDESELEKVAENRRIYPNSSDEINHNWLRHVADEDNPLREKAVLFWMHFIPIIGEGQKRVKPLIEIYRKNALGSLESLFLDLFQNPNFMSFLTAIDSTKDSPNQNLAREFLELFTLGVNHYSENDVRELARCFAGFVYKDETQLTLYLNHKNQDFDDKLLLGKRAHFNYQEAITWVISQPQTATYISKRVLQFYLTPEPTDEMVNHCATIYRKSGYNFQSLLEFMAHQHWFYNPKFMGNKVKTPIELLIQFQHQTGLRTFGLMCHWHLQNMLGQTLFNPPSVGGWPEGKQWLNSGILVNRLTILSNLLQISNRTHAKSSIAYKVHSWISDFNLRLFRWYMDAKFDHDYFSNNLQQHNIRMSDWLLGANSTKLNGRKNQSLGLSDLVKHPYYQYC